MNYKIKHILFVATVLLLSCSTKKNTLVTRTYHNITSKYNIYFNGNESYKKGIKKLTEEEKNDYNMILPIFPYPNSESSKGSFPEMERTIKKSYKLIASHSITAKPDYKHGIRTKRQKDFYNKKQYNKWIDDAYLLIGKANLIKGDYGLATETFRYIIKEFPKENTFDETQILLARTLILQEEYLEAEEILSQMVDNKELSKKLVSTLYATYADYYVKKKRYNDAIEKLAIAADKARDKHSRIRYTFILGQLYQATGQMKLATDMYLKVIKMNPPYEITFNARINLAGTYEAGNTNADEIRKQLYKLLNDEKNKEYQDQLYYALANIDYKQGNIDKALVNYSLSARKSVSNLRQKARSYLAIADIKYDRKLYLVAQAYYDSAMHYIDESYPGYDKINARAKSLKRLVKYLNNVSFEDSVQFIAKMSENERNMFIDKIIDKVKENEAEEQKKRQEEQMAIQTNMINASEIESAGATNQTDGGKWYFYSPSAKGYGEADFQMKWGNRKLEDNWRRSIKKSVAFDSNEEQSEEEDKETKKKVKDNKSREFYSDNLPLTDSLMDVSHNNIRKSLFNSGMIYKDELNEYNFAAKQFADINRRYPTNPMVADASYQLYIIYRQLENTAKADEYKTLLITKFPESIYAKLLTNPNYAKELQQKEDSVYRLYESAYNDYIAGNFNLSLSKIDQGLKNYPNHKLVPKFLLLKALDKGKLPDLTSMRNGLNSLIKDYPKSDEASSAKDIITMMDYQHPEIKQVEEKAIAKEIYNDSTENLKHFFAVVVNPKKANQNQMVFNLINFNLDNYSNANLTVKADNFGKTNQVVLVREFKNKAEALNYYDAAIQNTELYKDVGTGVLATFIISDLNFEILKKDGSESRYMEFFKDSYER